MTNEPPCLNHRGFLQPEDTTGWQFLPATLAARALRQDRCAREIFLACAHSALTAGTCVGDDRQRVADGVVMAGVVCRGDAFTEKAIRKVIRQYTSSSTRRAAHCLDCHKPMTTRHRKLPGHVIHDGGGMCARCRRARQRSA
ncbi:hypothetical protein ACFV4K_13725 [Nocardia sp. NPDC059764]|uniref:hypothetical protein n=1 Tax=Nocardia sp. NPDC059764 TaxID=3346939 RepID=UPI0036577489